MSLRGRDRDLAEALRMGFKPQCPRGPGRIEVGLLPPRRFITVTMELTVMTSA
jgi:hypothetical protein